MNAPEINGKPAVKLSFSLAEKVNVGNFSNVDVGPVIMEKWCEDDPQAIERARDEVIEFVEDMMAHEREKVYDFIKDKPKVN